MKILYIEDSDIAVQAMRAIVKRLGYEFLTVPSIAEGDQLIKDQHPDVILIDMQLPDGLGFNLIRQLRVDGLTTPIIGLSSVPDYSERSLAEGSDKFILKPFDFSMMSDLIKSYAR